MKTVKIMSYPVQNKAQIFDLIGQYRATIEQFGAARLGLFGSFVRDEQSDDSDVDFLVEFKEGMKKYKNLIKLATLLEEVTQRKIDLLTWEGIAPFVQREIEKEIEYVSFTD
jgi:predicted nucleotidyltransferase